LIDRSTHSFIEGRGIGRLTKRMAILGAIVMDVLMIKLKEVVVTLLEEE
jgi:hypothetical protein